MERRWNAQVDAVARHIVAMSSLDGRRPPAHNYPPASVTLVVRTRRRANDVVARVLAERMRVSLGQPGDPSRT